MHPGGVRSDTHLLYFEKSANLKHPNADYVHIRKFADADKNLIHIIHIEIFSKNGHFFGPKMGQHCSVFNSDFPKYHYCSSLLVLSILRNENRSPESRYFGQKNYLFTIRCGCCASMRIWCASMRFGKYRHMAIPSFYCFLLCEGWWLTV